MDLNHRAVVPKIVHTKNQQLTLCQMKRYGLLQDSPHLAGADNRWQSVGFGRGHKTGHIRQRDATAYATQFPCLLKTGPASAVKTSELIISWNRDGLLGRTLNRIRNSITGVWGSRLG